MQQAGDNRTVDKVLTLLENNRESFFSGARIAEELGVSRNAIWKAIKDLQGRGYNIEAVSNKGYRLSGQNDIISREGICAALAKSAADYPGDIIVYEAVESTNNVAKELAIKGTSHGTCVVSGIQVSGRGRKDHSFYSPSGGIYMSVVLSPERLSFSKSDEIIRFIGNAVCRAIEKYTGLVPDIKGINDLYIDDKKICGILIESGSEFDSGTLQWIVAGIGINFDSDINSFPKELRGMAASLFAPGKADITKNELIAEILMEMIVNQ